MSSCSGPLGAFRLLAHLPPAIYRQAFNGLLGFPPGCQGFGGEDENTDLEVGVGRGPCLWYHNCSGLASTGSNLHCGGGASPAGVW